MTGIDEIADLLYLFENVGLVGVEEKDNDPPETDKMTNAILLQNLPNPFHHSTVIRYQIPSTNHKTPITNHITLKVYDIAGRLVETLVNETSASHAEGGTRSTASAGGTRVYQVRWDGKNSQGEWATSGLYFFVLKSGEYHRTKPGILLR